MAVYMFRMVLMVLLAGALLAGGMAMAQARPDGALYEQGLRQIEGGQFERARLSLQTLLNVYPSSPLRDPARTAIRTSWIREGMANPDAMLLFQEGQTRLSAGRHDAARLAFQTLINLYPSSEYAVKARRLVDAPQ